MEKTRRILVVDDEADLCDILRFNLEVAGYEVETAQSAEDADFIDVFCDEGFFTVEDTDLILTQPGWDLTRMAYHYQTPCIREVFIGGCPTLAKRENKYYFCPES